MLGSLSSTLPTGLKATLLTVCVIFAATQVVVALQHEDGRVQGTFSPTTSLWDVVSQLAERPPDEEQTEPLLVYMNQQVGEATRLVVVSSPPSLSSLTAFVVSRGYTSVCKRGRGLVPSSLSRGMGCGHTRLTAFDGMLGWGLGVRLTCCLFQVFQLLFIL